MSDWEELRLGNTVAAGIASTERLRVWVHGSDAGTHELRAFAENQRCVAEATVELGEDGNRTAAATLQLTGCAGQRILVQLCREGQVLAACQARLCPGDDAWAHRHVSFAVASCHQPFSESGELLPAAVSMLDAAAAQCERDEVAFALLMGDQLYTDAPQSKSLFEPEYFASLDEGESILACSSDRVRRILHRRYERFMAVPGFSKLLASVATIPMPDDHEFIDNFGTHPEHATAHWAAFKDGALQAYRDYQGTRACLDREDPDALDYGFTWGPLAVYGLDIRRNRATSEGKTQAFSDAQFEALRTFLSRHGDMPALALMNPIPLVHVESAWVNAAASLLSLGSDLHERWSHSSCIEARDALLALLLDHAQRNPKQKIILLGGDVHAGSAYQIDFPECGVQMVQLTSSPLSNDEGWLNARAGELAAQAVSSVELADGRRAIVTALRGQTPKTDRNPFGGLNLGIVDVSTNGEGVATISLRLVGHDGSGGPTTVLDTGALGRRPDPTSGLRIV